MGTSFSRPYQVIPASTVIISSFFGSATDTSPFGVLPSPEISYKTPNYRRFVLKNLFHLPMATLTRPKSLPQSTTNSLLNSRIPTPFPIDQLYQDSCEDHRPSSGSNYISPPENVQVSSSRDSTIEGPSTTTLVSSRLTSQSNVLFTFTLGGLTAIYCPCSEVLSNDSERLCL